MKLPVNWLKEYVDVKMSPKQLADHLTMIGQEVETREDNHNFDKVVVGEVLSVKKHPNADKLYVTKVNVGVKDPLQIVCGASNLAVGIKVPVVVVGGEVSDFKITKADLRGIESFGMICSEKELDLGNDHKGILILDQKAKVGIDFKEYLDSETVIDVKVQPNRPDCMGIWGLAREAAAGNTKLVLPEIKISEESNVKTSDFVEIQVDEPDLCPRYITRVVKDVKVEPSPRWLHDRLKSAGVRPINNIVDISNYVMFETGQPLHFFDLDKLRKTKKKVKIIVRRSRENEQIKTLDGTIQKLNKDMLLISNDKEGVAVAGVMGGENSEVDENTKNILIEAAVFDKTSIRKTARMLNLRSEAVSRFEKGLPLDLPAIAIDRAVQLLDEIANGKITQGTVDSLNRWIWIQHLGLSVSKTNAFLGVEIKSQEMVNILQSLGFEAEKFDITREAKKHLGKPYLYGASYKKNKTDAFDCSYLTDYIYSLINIQIGHTSLGQLHHGWDVETKDLKPGDVLFYKGHIDKSVTNEYYKNDGRGNHTRIEVNKYPDGVGHNGLYVGNGKVIHASAYSHQNGRWLEKTKSEQKVEIVPLEYFINNPEYIGARRYVEKLDDLIAVTVPWWRSDIVTNADLCEEIARIWGYEKISSTLPNIINYFPREKKSYQFLNNLRQLLAHIGLTEIYTYPFVSAKDIITTQGEINHAPKVQNPLHNEQEYLRISLIPSMLKALSSNQFVENIVQFFEISQTFKNRGVGILPQENKILCIGIKHDGGEKKAFDLAKGILRRILAEYKIEEEDIKDGFFIITIPSQQMMEHFGLKKKSVILYINLDEFQKKIDYKIKYKVVSKFPYVDRDISVIFKKSKPAKEILDSIKNCSNLMINSKIIDIYEGKPFGENEKSVTIRITLSSFEKTLEDLEIDNIINLCTKKIISIGGEIRSGK